MKRIVVLLVGLAPLVSLAALLIIAGYPSRPTGRVYTLAQVEGDLLQHRDSWAGRDVLVRSVLRPTTDKWIDARHPYPSRYYALAPATSGLIQIPSVLLDMGDSYPQTNPLHDLPLIGALVPNPDPQIARPALYSIRILRQPNRCRGAVIAPYSCPDALFIARWS